MLFLGQNLIITTTNVMDLIFELLITNFIVHFLGVNTRYYYFKLIGEPKTKKYLKGEFKKVDNVNSLSQNLLNGIVGFISFTVIGLTFVCVYYTYF